MWKVCFLVDSPSNPCTNIDLLIDFFYFSFNMDEAPCVRLCGVHGHQGRSNDVVFCGTEAQQHVVYFHGDVQVSKYNPV